MISFNLIDSIIKFWFWFKFWCFKAVVDTKRIRILVKGCDSWWICGSGGNTFNMIIFDLINILFKCWFWFEFSASKLLFIQSWSKFLSKDVVILLISNCDGSLTDISLITSVVSERHDFFELIVTILFSIYSYENLFGSILCSHLNSISCSYCFSKHWSRRQCG